MISVKRSEIMGIDISLPPEWERFAQSCVETGRYHDLNEVVRSGLQMLQAAEEQRAAFLASLNAATSEAEQRGFRTAEQVETSVLNAIVGVERRG
jgi:antitoxin ParD1/3/4